MILCFCHPCRVVLAFVIPAKRLLSFRHSGRVSVASATRNPETTLILGTLVNVFSGSRIARCAGFRDDPVGEGIPGGQFLHLVIPAKRAEREPESRNHAHPCCRDWYFSWIPDRCCAPSGMTGTDAEHDTPSGKPSNQSSPLRSLRLCDLCVMYQKTPGSASCANASSASCNDASLKKPYFVGFVDFVSYSQFWCIE